MEKRYNVDINTIRFINTQDLLIISSLVTFPHCVSVKRNKHLTLA